MVSTGMPTADSTGSSTWPSSSSAPDARSIYTADSRATKGGTMPAVTFRPSPAPDTSAPHRSTRRKVPHRATASIRKGTSMA